MDSTPAPPTIVREVVCHTPSSVANPHQIRGVTLSVVVLAYDADASGKTIVAYDTLCAWNKPVVGCQVMRLVAVGDGDNLPPQALPAERQMHECSQAAIGLGFQFSWKIPSASVDKRQCFQKVNSCLCLQPGIMMPLQW